MTLKSKAFLSIAVSLTLVGCGLLPGGGGGDSSSSASSNNSATSESSSTTTSSSSESTTSLSQEEVIEKIKENGEVDSLHLELEFSLKDPSHEKSQQMIQDVSYSGTTIKGMNLTIDTATKDLTTNKSENSTSKMVLTTDSVLWEQANNSDWEERGQISSNALQLNPEYYELTTQLYEVLSEVDMEETSNEYIFTYEGTQLALASLFEKTFDIQLTGVNDADLNKTLEVVYDKETFLIKSFKFGFDYSRDGQSIILESTTVFSDLNNVDDAKFEAPTSSNGL